MFLSLKMNRTPGVAPLVSVYDNEILPFDFIHGSTPHLLDGILVLTLVACDGFHREAVEWCPVIIAKPGADGQTGIFNFGFPIEMMTTLWNGLGQLDGLAKGEIVLNCIHNKRPRSIGVMILKM
jgi:hypothetical protein